MSTAIPGVSSTTATGSTATTGSSTLSSDAFMKLMINQLSHQDPMNPTDSNQLLTQISQISQLQANTTLTSNLQTMTLQQSIGSAGNLIGKSIQGLDDGGNAVTGTVTSIKVQNQKVRLELDNGTDLPMENVTTIAAVNPASSSGALAAALSALASGSNPASASAAAAGSGTPTNTIAPLAPATGTNSSSSALAALLNMLAGAH
jgi:flagellar basal-body rod modification protein FlgD